MPFAEFQPSDAGDLLNERVLRNADFSASLMERAARNRALLEDVESRKQQYVDNHLLSAQQIQANRRQLAEMKREEDVRGAREQVAVYLADSTGRRALREADALAVDEAAVRQAGAVFNETLARVNEAKSPEELFALGAAFQGKYGDLFNHPVFGAEYAALDQRLGARIQAQSQVFAHQAQQIGDFLTAKIDPTDAEAMGWIRRHPHYALARRYAPFAQAFDEAERTRAAGLALVQRGELERQSQRGELERQSQRGEPGAIPAASPGAGAPVAQPLVPGQAIRYSNNNYIYLGEAGGQTLLRGADNQEYTVPHVLNSQR